MALSKAGTYLFFSLLCFCISRTAYAFVGRDSLIHELTFSNPVNKVLGEQSIRIIENTGSDGIPVCFFLEVNSVDCLDSVCKIVPVKISWDLLGNYQEFSIAEPYKLEKLKGEPFSKADYQKLDKILKDNNSVFRETSIKDITKVTDVDGVDAVSGATAIIFGEKDVVPGAALTCYTLWHWAHSSLTDTIRNISGTKLGSFQLRKYLDKSDDFKKFAIEQFTRKNDFSTETLVAILQRSTADTSGWSKLQMAYLEQAPDSIYKSSIKYLIRNGHELQQIASLKSLLNTSKGLPAVFLDQISGLIPYLHSYQSIDLLLQLMETRNHDSSVLVENVLILLNKPFLIARRAYWFLSERKLNSFQKEEVSKFYIKHKGSF